MPDFLAEWRSLAAQATERPWTYGRVARFLWALGNEVPVLHACSQVDAAEHEGLSEEAAQANGRFVEFLVNHEAPLRRVVEAAKAWHVPDEACRLMDCKLCAALAALEGDRTP